MIFQLPDSSKKENRTERKLKINEKYINYTEDQVRQLRLRYRNGASCDNDRLLFTIQSVFSSLAVIPSIDKGFIDPSGIFSGDGSSLHISADSSGHKVVESDDPEALMTRYPATSADID